MALNDHIRQQGSSQRLLQWPQAFNYQFEQPKNERDLPGAFRTLDGVGQCDGEQQQETEDGGIEEPCPA